MSFRLLTCQSILMLKEVKPEKGEFKWQPLYTQSSEVKSKNLLIRYCSWPWEGKRKWEIIPFSL